MSKQEKKEFHLLKDALQEWRHRCITSYELSYGQSSAQLHRHTHSLYS